MVIFHGFLMVFASRMIVPTTKQFHQATTGGGGARLGVSCRRLGWQAIKHSSWRPVPWRVAVPEHFTKWTVPLLRDCYIPWNPTPKNIKSTKKHEILKQNMKSKQKPWNPTNKTWHLPQKDEIKKQKHEIPKKNVSKKHEIPKKHESHPKKTWNQKQKNMKSHYIPLIPIQFTLNHPALWLAPRRWRDHVAISSGNRGCLVVLVIIASSNHGYN